MIFEICTPILKDIDLYECANIDIHIQNAPKSNPKNTKITDTHHRIPITNTLQERKKNGQKLGKTEITTVTKIN